MSRNVEIKARIGRVDSMLTIVQALADAGPVQIPQDDTFFRCDAGRLKLREFTDGSAELIFYRRVDSAGPKESFFLRTSIATPAVLRESLSLAYGQVGRVRKHRTLFMSGRTRIHLDSVEGLGDFLELEVLLRDGEAAHAGARDAHELMRNLGISPSQLIAGAYIDLLTEMHRSAAPGSESSSSGR